MLALRRLRLRPQWPLYPISTVPANYFHSSPHLTARPAPSLRDPRLAWERSASAALITEAEANSLIKNLPVELLKQAIKAGFLYDRDIDVVKKIATRIIALAYTPMHQGTDFRLRIDKDVEAIIIVAFMFLEHKKYRIIGNWMLPLLAAEGHPLAIVYVVKQQLDRGTYKPSLLSRHVESLSQLQLVDAMVLHGMILQLNGKFKEAAGLYHEAMVRIDNSNVYTSQQFQNPFNLAKVPQAWEMYAALKCEMGDIPAALDVVKRNALEHEHPAAFRLLATLAKQHNNLPLADYELYLTKAAMAADPIACCLLGQFYVEGYLENVKNVEGSVKSYFRPPPKSPTERFYRKYPHRELLNKAIDWYEIANNYGYEWAALPLAWIFREQGNLKEGMYYLDIAAKVQKCAHEAEQFRKVFNTRDLKVPFKEYILNKRPF